MPHNCHALLLHCMDFRLQKDIKHFMEEHGLLGDCDVVSLAGAAKNILDPGTRDLVLHQIDVSKTLHGISVVHLMNHTDCGAYGGHAGFANLEAEREKHIEDLKAAAGVIKDLYPDLAVVKWIAHIEKEGNVEDIWFEELA